MPVVLELTRLECANAGAPAAATSSSQYQLLKNRPFFSRASIEKMFVDDVELNENLGAPSAAASCAVQRMRDSAGSSMKALIITGIDNVQPCRRRQRPMCYGYHHRNPVREM